MLTTTTLITWLTSLENKEHYEYVKMFKDEEGKEYTFVQSPHLVNVWTCEELDLVIKASTR